MTSKTRRSRTWAASVVAAGLLAIAGCSASGSANTSVDGGGTLMFARTGVIDNLDPVTVPGVFAFVTQPVYDALLWEREGEKLEPGLATAWKVDPAALTVTLTLRKGVTFTDGSPFNAAAVKANFDRAKQEKASPYAATFYGRIAEVQTPDEYTAVIKMSEVIPDVLIQLARPQSYMISPKALQNPTAVKTAPVGTGPYVINQKQSVIGTHYIYDRNPNYWNKDLQKVDHVEMRLLDSRDAVMAAAQSGEVDVIDNLVGNEVAASEAFPNRKLINGSPINSFFLWNLDHEGKKVKALGDQRVRQAMAYAIDTQGFIDGVLHGEGKATNQLAAPGNFAYDPQLDHLYGYDKAKAKSLLAEAGFPDGFKCDGYVMKGHAIEPWQTGAASMLEDVGIKMTLNPIDVAAYASEARSGKYTCLALNAAWRDPAQFYNEFLNVQTLNTAFGPLDADIAALAKTGDSTFDTNARGKAYQQMFRLMAERGYLIPLMQLPQAASVSTSVQGIELTGTYQQPWDPRGVSKSEG